MPKDIARFDFAQFLQPGAATLNDRVNEHLLGLLEASQADGFQAARGALEKHPGHLLLSSVNPTGGCVYFEGNAAVQGIWFPDHAKYDLGLRWTIDVVFKAHTIPASASPLVWRADDSNNEITTLELIQGTSAGRLRFTHRDSNGSEVVLTTNDDTIANLTVYAVRVVRFYENLSIYIDGELAATTASLSATYPTAACDNKLFVGVATHTDGDTAISSGVTDAWIDDLRIFREEIDDDHRFTRTAWPWARDKRLALLARFDESSGSVIDASPNENHGTVIGADERGATELVQAVSPILQIVPFVAEDGTTKWCIWTADKFYAVDAGI